MNIAIVTGASSGMGREALLQLAGQFPGLDEIWAVARRADRLEELKEKAAVPVRALALDLTKKTDMEAFGGLLKGCAPKVKFLVKSAGFGKIGKVSDHSLEDETDMVRLNCEALTAVTRLVLPYMSKNSRIIQFASSAAFLPQPGFADSPVCKLSV